MNKNKKILIFGAGRIGRSFIGQLFTVAGYGAVFVDSDHVLVQRLNEKKSYPVIILDSNHPELEKNLKIENIRALHSDWEDEILNEIAHADILATSVGKEGLVSISEILARGIKKRFENTPGRPLDIIIAENIRNADSFLEVELKKNDLNPFPAEYVGLIKTSIGKMVPIMTTGQMEADPLAVFAEPYNTLILDGKSFRNPVPEVAGLSPKENMKAWVDRKLFIHNMGHAALAYQSSYHHPELIYTYEALQIQSLKMKIRDTMLQSAVILGHIYPEEFTDAQLIEHSEDLLERFANKALGDTIFRVGCDLHRKLGRDDRLMAPILSGLSLNLPADLILEAWVKGCSFQASDEHGKELKADLEFKRKYGKEYNRILGDHCNLARDITATLYDRIVQSAPLR